MSFQNLEGAKTTFLDSFGMDLSAEVAPEEWRTAAIGFQKRHLVTHKLGVVDQEYITKTGDTRAVVGRKIGISAEEVRGLARIISNLPHACRITSRSWRRAHDDGRQVS